MRCPMCSVILLPTMCRPETGNWRGQQRISLDQLRKKMIRSNNWTFPQNWFQHLISSRNGGQWLAGKAMDSFCPIGPAIATRFDRCHFYLRCRHHNDDPSTNACFCVLTTSQFKIIPSNISNNRWIFQGRDQRPPQLEPLMYCQRSCKTGSPSFIFINESSSLSII